MALVDSFETSLIPALPPELALACIGRVHPVNSGPLHAISSAWKQAFTSGAIEQARELEGCQEEILALGLADRLDPTGLVDIRFFSPKHRLWWRAPPFHLSSLGPAAWPSGGTLAEYQIVAQGSQLFVGGAVFKGNPHARGPLSAPTEVWVLGSPFARAWRKLADAPPRALLAGVDGGSLRIIAPINGSLFSTDAYLLDTSTGVLRALGPRGFGGETGALPLPATRNTTTAELTRVTMRSSTPSAHAAPMEIQKHQENPVRLQGAEEGGRRTVRTLRVESAAHAGAMPAKNGLHKKELPANGQFGVAWHPSVPGQSDGAPSGAYLVRNVGSKDGSGAREALWNEIAQLPPRTPEDKKMEGCITAAGYVAAKVGPTICILQKGQAREVPHQGDTCQYDNNTFVIQLLDTSALGPDNVQKPKHSGVDLAWDSTGIPLNSLGATVIGCAVVKA